VVTSIFHNPVFTAPSIYKKRYALVDAREVLTVVERDLDPQLIQLMKQPNV